MFLSKRESWTEICCVIRNRVQLSISQKFKIRFLFEKLNLFKGNILDPGNSINGLGKWFDQCAHFWRGIPFNGAEVKGLTNVKFVGLKLTNKLKSTRESKWKLYLYRNLTALATLKLKLFLVVAVINLKAREKIKVNVWKQFCPLSLATKISSNSILVQPILNLDYLDKVVARFSTISCKWTFTGTSCLREISRNSPSGRWQFVAVSNEHVPGARSMQKKFQSGGFDVRKKRARFRRPTDSPVRQAIVAEAVAGERSSCRSSNRKHFTTIIKQ